MVSDITEMRVPFRTQYFQESVTEFRHAVEQLVRAAEELEGAAIYFDDPVSGRPTSVGFDDVFDMEIGISIKPTRRRKLFCDRCGTELHPETHEPR